MTDLLTLAWTFVRLSFLCVGGGLGVVPEMQRQVVGIHGWLTARQFVDGYALAQVTPGPGMLVSAFIGYRVYGLLGAFVAMTAMFLPTSLLTWFVARHWQRLQGRPWALAVERGLAPLAIGLMAAGVYRRPVCAHGSPHHPSGCGRLYHPGQALAPRGGRRPRRRNRELPPRGIESVGRTSAARSATPPACD
ncbi:MAG TPA: chromate transporter, partial [Candidatus Methylomirabilis sp.]